jgi:hypothetical protein
MDEHEKQKFLKLPSIKFSLRVRLNGLTYCIEANKYGIDHWYFGSEDNAVAYAYTMTYANIL